MTDLSKGANLTVDPELANEIRVKALAIITELFDSICLKKGDIWVIGCSSSEMLGNKIGKGSSFDAAKLLFEIRNKIKNELNKSVMLFKVHISC